MGSKNKVNIILGIISIISAAALLADIIYCYEKYHTMTGMNNILPCTVVLTIGAFIMSITGIVLIKSRKNAPFKRTAIMLLLLIGVGFGTACVNSMLDYVARAPEYEASEE
ncbi:MAG: hypothetical protein J5501_09640 [Ruminococcus sp.]|nr:hypothetical protein [Ruminococcus sp.]